MTTLSTGLLEENPTQWIKEHQPSLYQLLSQSLTKQTLSHAYLVVGQKDVLEIAQWIAALIVEQNLNENQLNQRIKAIAALESIDVQLLDGTSESIKKEAIINLQHQFSQAAKEVTGQKVAILHHVENASIQALNSLLKSIEEPSGTSTTYILTSDNLNQVLPTIQSRCVNITCEEYHQDALIESFEKLGIDHLSAYLISQLTSSTTKAQQILNDYQLDKLSQIIYQYGEDRLVDIDLANVNLQLNCPNDRQEIEHLFKMMTYHFKKTKDYKLAEAALNTLSKINRSVYVPLLVDQFCANVKEVIS